MHRTKKEPEPDDGATQKTQDHFDLTVLRLEALAERIGSSKPNQDEVALEAFSELRSTIEELQIAEEELRQQNDELVAMRFRLEEERYKYEDLFESAPDGYLITDAKGLILKANRAAATLIGLDARFLVGKLLILYVASADQRTLLNQLNRLLKSDPSDAESLDLRISPRKGEDFDASLKVSTSRDRDGNLTELRWSMRDVTEIKKAAENYRLLNTELEERVRRRTAELEQVNALKDELLLREKRARLNAEAANRSKDDFLAIVSHELRTPLNAILGWAQLMRRDVTDDDQRRHAAEIIERSARAQARLINDILDVSRVVSGGLPLDKRPVNFAKVIEAAVEAARPSIEAKGISLTVSLNHSDALVVGDSVRLQQIVANLLSNSTKFTKRGGAIDVTLAPVDESWRITVTDTGCGISKEFLPLVFDRFSQADSQFTRQQGGMGLGLAIVKVLVELHDGTVTATSAGSEKGSTFAVVLPAAPTSATVAEGPWERLDGPVVTSKLASVWIVVVDDDFDAREMMRAVLEDSGARVTTCGSYDEALALFEERSTTALSARLPDVVVADIAMPGHDGFDLIRAIRRLGPMRGGEVPAIALTAYTDDETRHRALDEGYQRHLTKPLNLQELVSAIVQLVKSRG